MVLFGRASLPSSSRDQRRKTRNNKENTPEQLIFKRLAQWLTRRKWWFSPFLLYVLFRVHLSAASLSNGTVLDPTGPKIHHY